MSKCLEKYKDFWHLSQLSLMPTNTASLLFSCESRLYGSCVLKVCPLGSDPEKEINCLQAYGGRGYCRLWAYDLEAFVLLLERVIPGDQMWIVPDYRDRARIFATILKDLPIPYDGQEKYPSYLSWLEDLGCSLAGIGSLEELLFYLDKAKETYAELKQRYNRTCLLHGDLHPGNILLNSKGGYTIIDPKRVVDDPVMETARFLINETPCEEGKVREMASIMSPLIAISEEDILKSMFVDAVLSSGWRMEEKYLTQEAFEKEKRRALKACKFAYDLCR